MFKTLISATELLALAPGKADGPVLLDCRFDLTEPAAGLRQFALGHIEGAQHADLGTTLAAPAHSAPGPQRDRGGRHPLPDRTKFARQCVAWGIGPDTQVVTYDNAGGAFAARAWWMLRWLGHSAVAVLDGGLAQWQWPLIAVEADAQRSGARSATKVAVEVTGNEHKASLLAGRPPITRSIDVTSVQHELETAVLIDARAQQRFDAAVEPIDPVAGHISGAFCLPHTGNLGGNGCFLAPAELRARFAQLADPICYCGSGVTATHNILAICHAGLPEPRLYVGSWSEWLRDPSRSRGPSSATPATRS